MMEKTAAWFELFSVSMGGRFWECQENKKNPQTLVYQEFGDLAEKEGFELEKANYIGKNAVQLSYVLSE